ncbi:MAG: alpha/beta hydrolase [Pseudomonadota bacterium]
MLQQPSRLRTFSATLCLGVSMAAPLAAQSGADLFALQFTAQTDPAAASAEIADTLAALQSDPQTDPQLVFDLRALRAEIAEAAGTPDAPRLVMELAAMALRMPELDKDPVALFARAQALYEAQDDLNGAQVAADEKLTVMLERAYTPETIAAAYLDFARISEALGDFGLAERATALADTVVAPIPQAGVAPGDGDDTAILVPNPSASGTRSDGSSEDTAANFRSIDVYYATDRAVTGQSDPARVYGSGRGGLDLGVATVTVPISHTPGMLESKSIWRLEFRDNPSKHVILQSVTRLPEDVFFADLSAEFDADKTEAFVFIHGYNVTFDQAAKRAAQMAYDMNYPAVPILYSWPSRGSTLAYVADSAVVRLSGRRLADFLDQLVARSGAETIHIVAHSMGNRALTDALEILALRRGVGPGDTPLFGQVLFAAPDVDAGLFVRMAQTIRPIAKRLTLYASEQDWALVSSRKLHGNAPRAGQGGDVTLVDSNIDSIDMSELGEDMLAHSYFADESSALADMVALFWRDAPPDRRCGLEPMETGDSAAPVTWRYREGTCETDALIGALSQMRRAGIVDPGRISAFLTSVITEPGLIDRLEPPLRRLFQP